jgi:Fungal fucose-specific lectin/Astacin (Peptidase family M12A)
MSQTLDRPLDAPVAGIVHTCSLRTLPNELLVPAAAKAVEVNPANAPSLQFAPGVAIEPAHLAVLTSKYWGTGGVHLTVQFLDNPPADLRARILSHMNAWGAFANVAFVETAVHGQVRIARTPGDGYWSYLGTDVLVIAQDQPTMNLANFSMNMFDSEFYRVVRHETGHTLGFPHEHLRSEIVNRIDQAKAIAFFQTAYGWSAQQTINNVLTAIPNSALIATAQTDIHSIMSYWLPASIMKDGIAVDGGNDIDFLDAQFAASVYPVPHVAGWHYSDISAGGAPAAAGDPDGYVFEAQGTQHVVYRGADAAVHELWWDPAYGWSHADLSAQTAAPAAAGDPAGYVFGAQATQHVVYTGTDGHVHELWWYAGGGWAHGDLSAQTAAPSAAGDPAGYVFDAQGTQHVVYRGTDAGIHELWWDPAYGWQHGDLSAQTAAPAAAGDPAGYVFDAQGSQHVVYTGTDGHVHELWWDPAYGWQHADLSVQTGAPAATGDPDGYVFAAQATQHVVYRGTDGAVHELWWAADSAWSHADLSGQTGAPAAAGDPAGYMFDAEGSQHVVYRGTDGAVHELWWAAESAWSHADLSGQTGAPAAAGDPTGYLFRGQGTQHVVYRGNDAHLHEEWWG